jgi:hypothetical protein
MQPHFHCDEDGRSGKGLGGDWRHGMAWRAGPVTSKASQRPRPLTLLCSSCHINSTCAPSDARPLSSTLQRAFPSPARFALRLRQGETAKLVARHRVTRYKYRLTPEPAVSPFGETASTPFAGPSICASAFSAFLPPRPPPLSVPPPAVPEASLVRIQAFHRASVTHISNRETTSHNCYPPRKHGLLADL